MYARRVRTLILALISLCLSACNKSQEEYRPAVPKITVTTARKKDVTLTQQYVCQIESYRHIQVRAPLKGNLGAVHVKEGQAVRQNDVLFRLMPMTDRTLIGARSEDKLVSITAPFDGTVNRLHEDGQVEQGEALADLSDNSMMRVYFHVPEARYLEYMAERAQQQGDPKIELVLANDRKFNQTGKFVAIEADFNGETGNIPFRADFPNPEGVLRHGQRGTVLMTRVLVDALVIPQRTTFERDNKRYVYVVDKDDVVHRREIVVQNEFDDLFVVRKGIDVDDKIVLEGVRQVRDGLKVEYKNREPAGESSVPSLSRAVGSAAGHSRTDGNLAISHSRAGGNPALTQRPPSIQRQAAMNFAFESLSVIHSVDSRLRGNDETG